MKRILRHFFKIILSVFGLLYFLVQVFKFYICHAPHTRSFYSAYLPDDKMVKTKSWHTHPESIFFCITSSSLRRKNPVPEISHCRHHHPIASLLPTTALLSPNGPPSLIIAHSLTLQNTRDIPDKRAQTAGSAQLFYFFARRRAEERVALLDCGRSLTMSLS